MLTDESILLDLKHLLIEAKQKVPLFLAEMSNEQEQYLNIGGKYPSRFILLTGKAQKNAKQNQIQYLKIYLFFLIYNCR